MQSLKRIPIATKRVVLGPVPQQIAAVADEENVDLIIMSPRRQRGLRHWLTGGITDRVTRLSPCPVLSVTEPLPTKSWRGKSVRWYSGWRRQIMGPTLGPGTLNLGGAEKSQRESIPLTTSMQCSTWDHLLRVNSSPASFVPSCLISWLQQPNGHNKKGARLAPFFLNRKRRMID